MQVVFKHFRVPRGENELMPWFKPFTNKHGQVIRPDYEPSEKGGLTICILKDGDHVHSWGLAECSKKDTFCYAIGRSISQGRAEAWLRGESISYRMGEKSLVRPIFDEMLRALDIVKGKYL